MRISAFDPKRTLARIYSTMFALSTIDEGMVSPSAFAVFELTVNSNCEGLNRQISRLRPLQDLVNIICGLPAMVGVTRSVRH